jgi:hypothetical protein
MTATTILEAISKKLEMFLLDCLATAESRQRLDGSLKVNPKIYEATPSSLDLLPLSDE